MVPIKATKVKKGLASHRHDPGDRNEMILSPTEILNNYPSSIVSANDRGET